jgi:phosphotransferase system HPr-like phosphotransfer protein
MLAMLLLSGTFGMEIDLEANGTDEDQALSAITQVFESADPDLSGSGGAPADDEGQVV